MLGSVGQVCPGGLGCGQGVLRDDGRHVVLLYGEEVMRLFVRCDRCHLPLVCCPQTAPCSPPPEKWAGRISREGAEL